MDKQQDAMVTTDVESEEIKERFMTRPIPPINLRVGNKDKPLQICWNRSLTPTVNSYRVKWKPMINKQEQDDDNLGNLKTEEAVIAVLDTDQNELDEEKDDAIYFSFPLQQLQIGLAYRVNVFAIAEHGGEMQESRELHEKFVVKSATEVLLYTPDDQISDV